MFEAGKPRPANAGRKKGSKNIRRMLSAKDVLINADKHPVVELLALIPQLEPKERARYWLELLTFVEARPKVVEVQTAPPPAPPPEEKEDDETLLSLASA